MTKPIRVIQYGLGAIGQAAAQVVRTKPGMVLVAAIDPALTGSEVCGLPVQESLPDIEADAVIHCTGSSFAGVYEQLAEIVSAGLSCVTSCEEMLFPRYRNPELAEELNNLCVSNFVGVLGTGVNPGFVMDTLPVLLTAVSQSVRSIRVLRVVDAGTRREALQRKVGAGLTREEFQSSPTKATSGTSGYRNHWRFSPMRWAGLMATSRRPLNRCCAATAAWPA